MSEADLIRRARGGDQRAWESIVSEHRQAVFRLAYLTLSDPDEAEDIAQEVFVRATRSLHRFDPSRPLRPWLLRITSNVARNRLRSIGRYWQALRRAGREADSEPAFDLDGARLLWRAVRRLNHNGQQCIYLRYFLELSEREMAETMQVAPGTVKSRLHRALRQLRGVIERDFPELREGLTG